MASVSDQSDSGWWLVAGWAGYGSDLRSDDRRGFMGDPTRWSYRDTGVTMAGVYWPVRVGALQSEQVIPAAVGFGGASTCESSGGSVVVRSEVGRKFCFGSSVAHWMVR